MAIYDSQAQNTSKGKTDGYLDTPLDIGYGQTIPQSTVYANGKLISVNGSRGSWHAPGIHALNAWVTANGSSTVYINNISINDQGDADSCVHARVG